MSPLFVVSDVHGYLGDLLEGLAEFGLTTPEGRWTGDDAQLWFLGDLLDRGPDGIGVVNLVRSLQEQAPDQVHALMGNHEALALGMKRFPESDFPHSRFPSSWHLNGGLASDQEGLSDSHLSWLAELPLLARVGDYLFMHSDTTAYLGWGSSIEEINAVVRGSLSSSKDEQRHWDVWAQLTSRYHFIGRRGAKTAKQMLRRLGGQQVVHGHSIIGSLVDRPSQDVTESLRYADGLVLAIDGGRYDGGPLLVVRLQ